jgi:flagellar protein FliS
MLRKDTEMNPFAARAYHRVEIDTDVAGSDPHKLIQMLLDGALEAVRGAEGHLAAGRMDEKARLINRAVRILTEGLRTALNFETGGPIAQQLGQLYEYMTARLLRANLRNEPATLREVAGLLGEVRAGWVGIAPKRPAVTADPRAIAGRLPQPAHADHRMAMFT